MSVSILGLSPEGGLSWTFDGDGQRTYNLKLMLTTTTAPALLTTAVAVYNALVAANYYQGKPCPLDTSALCTAVSPRAARRRNIAGGAYYWEWPVDITYSSRAGQGSGQPSNEKDRLNRPPIIELHVEHYTEAAVADYFSAAKVQNSARDPQVREEKKSRIILKITKNYASFPIIRAADARTSASGFMYSRNSADLDFSDTVLGDLSVDAGSARLEDVRVVRMYDNNQVFAQVNFEIHFDPTNLFADKFRDMGFFYDAFDSYGHPIRRQFTDGAGHLSPVPRLLNGAGLPNPDGDPPHILSFQNYPTRDWSTLALPGFS